MNDTKCPSCGASMQIEYIGTLKDKILQCPYCHHQIDIDDSYYHANEKVTDEGTFKTVTFRQDGAGIKDIEDLKEILSKSDSEFFDKFSSVLSGITGMAPENSSDNILKKSSKSSGNTFRGKEFTASEKVTVSRNIVTTPEEAQEMMNSMKATLQELGFNTSDTNDNTILTGNKTIVKYAEYRSDNSNTTVMPEKKQFAQAAIIIFVIISAIFMLILYCNSLS